MELWNYIAEFENRRIRISNLITHINGAISRISCFRNRSHAKKELTHGVAISHFFSKLKKNCDARTAGS